LFVLRQTRGGFPDACRFSARDRLITKAAPLARHPRNDEPARRLERETHLPDFPLQNAAFVAFTTCEKCREFRDLHLNIIDLKPHRLLAPVLLEQV